MPDHTAAILSALRRDRNGFAIIWFPDYGLVEWLLAEVESLADPHAAPVQVTTVDEAHQHPDRLVLLVPDDEAEVVAELDARRDQFLDPPRSQPVVLFLMRGGDGQRALANAPALASVVRGSDPDPDAVAAIDPEVERAAFQADTGSTPEAWLVDWRAGQMPADPVNLARAYRALLLEQT